MEGRPIARVVFGLDGLAAIGSNDLAPLALGVARDSGIGAALFDESDTAVRAAIRDIITSARSAGITSVWVKPAAFDAARRVIGAAERRLLLDAARVG
ncbi:MAG: hypothetical protein FJW88_13370 [Actinobacteria bacterium]|nr:hypothetical protein [Actinomycetota bacterium]